MPKLWGLPRLLRAAGRNPREGFASAQSPGKEHPFDRLQKWYQAMTGDDGDWQHLYGVTIDNIDNPGWRLKVDLLCTHLEGVPFDLIQRQGDDEDDWFSCMLKKDGQVFYAAGGPLNLGEMIEIFLDWSNSVEGGPKV